MKKLIVANWKLNPVNLAEAQKLANSVERTNKYTVVLCPPAIFLSQIDYPRLGAQDCFWEDRGAFTGQISPTQLISLGVSYSLVGHSEKRAVGESDLQANAKVKALLSHKLSPILCVGYGTKVEQDDLEVTDVIKTQLDAGLQGADASKVIVAYEPVWAIGTGKNASAEHAEKIAIYIKTKFGVKKVLYGGSVNNLNAAEYLRQGNIDGLLVGGDSLIASHFNQIINL